MVGEMMELLECAGYQPLRYHEPGVEGDCVSVLVPQAEALGLGTKLMLEGLLTQPPDLPLHGVVVVLDPLDCVMKEARWQVRNGDVLVYWPALIWPAADDARAARFIQPAEGVQILTGDDDDENR